MLTQICGNVDLDQYRVRDPTDAFSFLRADVGEWSRVGIDMIYEWQFVQQIDACLSIHKDVLPIDVLSCPESAIRSENILKKMLTLWVLYRSVGPNLQIVHG